MVPFFYNQSFFHFLCLQVLRRSQLALKSGDGVEEGKEEEEEGPKPKGRGRAKAKAKAKGKGRGKGRGRGSKSKVGDKDLASDKGDIDMAPEGGDASVVPEAGGGAKEVTQDQAEPSETPAPPERSPREREPRPQREVGAGSQPEANLLKRRPRKHPRNPKRPQTLPPKTKQRPLTLTLRPGRRQLLLGGTNPARVWPRPNGVLCGMPLTASSGLRWTPTPSMRTVF